MQAVVFDGKALSLKYDDKYPMPTISKDDDVIVKVAYSGVCGTDLHIIQVSPTSSIADKNPYWFKYRLLYFSLREPPHLFLP